MRLELICVFSNYAPQFLHESLVMNELNNKRQFFPRDFCLNLLLFPLKKKRCVRTEKELRD